MNSNDKRTGGIFLFFTILIVAFVLLVPLPHDVTERYVEQVPYTVIEQYEEYVPISVEECGPDITFNPMELFERGVESLIEEDLNKLLEECEYINKLETITKTREVIKYKQETRYRTITRHDTLFEQWFG